MPRFRVAANSAHQVYLLDLHGHVDTTQTYTLVVRRLRKEREPLRLLTNLPLKRFSQKHLCRLYLERWGIENSFKRVKTKFGLERVRVGSFQRLKNLIALVQLALVLAAELYRRVQQSTRDLVLAVVAAFHAFQQSQHSLEGTLEAFISFLRQALPPLVHDPPPVSPQPSLFSRRRLAALR